MTKKLNEIIKKIWTILSLRQRILAGVLLVLAIVAGILEMIGVSVIIPLVNALLEPSMLLQYAPVTWVAGVFNIQTDSELVISVIASIIIIYILKNIYFTIFAWAKVKYANKIQSETATYMLQSYMIRGYRYFLDHNSNELRQCVETDVLCLNNIISSLIQIVTQVFISILICIFMFITDWQIATSIVLASVTCILIILFSFRKLVSNAGANYRKYSIITSKTLLEAIHGCKEVFVANKQLYYTQKFSKEVKLRQNSYAKQEFCKEIPAYIIEGLCITCIMIALTAKLNSVDNSAYFVSMLASIAVGAFRVLPALGKIASSINIVIASLPSLDAIYENIIESRNVQCDSNFLMQNSIYTTDAHFEDCIHIENIYFRYNQNTDYVLNNFSLVIKRGESVAFVGESGAGKSTLADIILGLLHPESGHVFVDGTDITTIPSEWSKIIGFVPQTIYLFDSTIRENVAFGVPEADIDEQQIKEALKKANLLSFIDSLPDGLNTYVGDRGVKLSGGQRQRIGIARALYHNPQVLIMDEATSALDNETENAVMEAIDALQGNTTLILIAHRITTLKNCNRIINLHNGNVEEKTYQELASTSNL